MKVSGGNNHKLSHINKKSWLEMDCIECESQVINETKIALSNMEVEWSSWKNVVIWSQVLNYANIFSFYILCVSRIRMEWNAYVNRRRVLSSTIEIWMYLLSSTIACFLD